MLLPRRRIRSNGTQWQGNATLNLSNELTQNLLLALYMRGEDAHHPPRDYVTGREGTRTDVTTTVSDRGVAGTYDGSTSCASIDVDLSAYKQITLSFYLWWDTFAANEDTALEYTAAVGVNNGFAFIPNWSGIAGTEMLAAVGSSQSAPTQRYAAAHIDRPTADAWHYYQILFDRDNGVYGVGGSSTGVFIDGSVPTYGSTNDTFDVGSYFDNSTLNIMCRNQSTWFGAGRIQCLTIHGGHLKDSQLRSQYRDPWQIMKPVDRIFWYGSAATRQPMVWMSP